MDEKTETSEKINDSMNIYLEVEEDIKEAIGLLLTAKAATLKGQRLRSNQLIEKAIQILKS